MGEGVDWRRHGERGGICAAIKCALDLRRAGRQWSHWAEWRRWQSGGAGRVKARDGRQWSHWTGGGLFGCLNIEPRMAHDLLDGLRVRFSLGE